MSFDDFNICVFVQMNELISLQNHPRCLKSNGTKTYAYKAFGHDQADSYTEDLELTVTFAEYVARMSGHC